MDVGDMVFGGTMVSLGALSLIPIIGPSVLRQFRVLTQAVPDRVALVVDLLNDSDWTESGYPRCLTHATGAQIVRRYDGAIESLHLASVEIPLNEAAKAALRKAVKSHLAGAQRREIDRATIEWAKRVTAYWERETVVPFEKRA